MEDVKKMRDAREILLELMYELRIDKKSLEVMSAGKSPNRPGNITVSKKDIGKWRQSHPVVQLSQWLADKIYELDLDWQDWS